MWFKKSKPSRKSQKMLEETSGPQKNIGKNRWKKIQMTTWQGSTRTRESLRNAAVYHGVKVNEFQAGLKNHSRLQKGFLLHGILVSSWAKKKNGGSQESTMQEFSRCRQEGVGFCLPIPQLWKCFSGGPMLLTDWMSTIISGSIFIMFAQIGQPFFSGVGVKLQKNTQTHTTQHLRNTFPEDALEKQLPRCQLMPSEPRNQNFPSTRRQRVPALRRMRPLQWLVTTSGGSCLQNVLSIWWFSVNCRGILSQTSCLLNEPKTLSFFFPPLWFSSPFGAHGCISVRQCIPQVPGSLSLKIHFCQWISQR